MKRRDFLASLAGTIAAATVLLPIVVEAEEQSESYPRWESGVFPEEPVLAEDIHMLFKRVYLDSIPERSAFEAALRKQMEACVVRSRVEQHSLYFNTRLA